MSDDDGTQLNADQLRDLYWSERRLLIEAQREATLALDRSLLTLSAGAIGLSLVLLERFAPTGLEVWSLIASWAAFVAAMVATLWSFRMSQGHLEAQRNTITAGYTYQTDPRVKEDPDVRQRLLDFLRKSETKRDELNKHTRRLNAVAIWSFGIGVILLVALAISSVLSPREIAMSGEKKTETTVRQPVTEKRGMTGWETPPDLVPKDLLEPRPAEPAPEAGDAPAGGDGSSASSKKE